MRLKLLARLLPAGVLAASALGQPVLAPWPADGSGPELNLYQILGIANNATLNSDIANQSGGALTTFSVPINSQYSTFIANFAGNASDNSFGVYGINSLGQISSLAQVFPGTPEGSTLGPVAISVMGGMLSVSGSAQPAVNISGDTRLGFYLNTGSLNPDYNTFYSSQINADDFQHIVAIPTADSPTYAGLGQRYILGMEDETASTTDFDHNDLVVSVVAAPEALSSFVLLSGACLLLGAVRRKLA